MGNKDTRNTRSGFPLTFEKAYAVGQALWTYFSLTFEVFIIYL